MKGGGEDGSNRWLIAGGSVPSTTTLEMNLLFSYKTEHPHTLWPSDTTPVYLPKGNSCMHFRSEKGQGSIAYSQNPGNHPNELYQDKKNMTCNEMNGLQLHVTPWMNLSRITLSQKKRSRQFHMDQWIENNIRLNTHVKCIKHTHTHIESNDKIQNSW